MKNSKSSVYKKWKGITIYKCLGHNIIMSYSKENIQFSTNTINRRKNF